MSKKFILEMDGIFSTGKAGQILIDMTTSSPALAKRIAKAGAKLQMAAIDAPVSGGDIGAKNGTLSIMCGGEEEVFNAITPILSVFGKQIVYQGAGGFWAACENVQSNCHCNEYDWCL